MAIDFDKTLAFARQVARDHQRVLAQRDVEFIRFLVDVTHRHGFSAGLLHTRVQWYVKYNASKVEAVAPPPPAAAQLTLPTSSAA